MNVIGEKVYTNTLVKGNNVVDLSGLANGAYFVKLNSNGSITTKKVVLSK
ncbi:MAG: T9SS type A sorting domain-containing protein [Bacteroidetes bacterium]|nr:T9SS type A sorting domain-containing protein [Bacteroidota bacterium]